MRPVHAAITAAELAGARGWVYNEAFHSPARCLGFVTICGARREREAEFLWVQLVSCLVAESSSLRGGVYISLVLPVLKKMSSVRPILLLNLVSRHGLVIYSTIQQHGSIKQHYGNRLSKDSHPLCSGRF
jgi:hypothetical protein